MKITKYMNAAWLVLLGAVFALSCTGGVESQNYDQLPPILGAMADVNGNTPGCPGCRELAAGLEQVIENGGRWGRAIAGGTAAGFDFDGNLWAGAVGSEDPAGLVPATTETKLRISSASKQFTTVLILRLQADGVRNPNTGDVISLDDKLSDYGCGNSVNQLCGWGAPEFNPGEQDNPIRVRHLVGNTSGMPTVLDDPEFIQRHLFFGPRGTPGAVPGNSQAIPEDAITAEVMIQTFTVDWWIDRLLSRGAADSSAWIEPGMKFEYNNLGHTLVSLIIEELSGLAYRDALQVHLFGPAGIRGISEEIGEHADLAPGWGDGLFCFFTAGEEPYLNGHGQPAQSRCTSNFQPPPGVPGVDGCRCNDNQGWVALEGYYGSFGQGAGGVAATASGLASYLRKLHASHPALEGAWGPGLLPVAQYAQLYEWECDNDDPALPECDNFFHQYGHGFYSRYKVAGDPTSGLVYGHQGGGHLPCHDMIDWSTGSIYVTQVNRKTLQIDNDLMWSAYVAGLETIGGSPSSLAR